MDNSWTTDGNPVAMLTDDCLREIFKRLSMRDKLTVEKVCKRWREISVQGWPDQKEWNGSEFGAQIDDKDSTNDDKKLTIEECFVALQRCGRYLRKVSFTSDSTQAEIPNIVKKSCHRLEEMTIWMPSKFHEAELTKQFLKNMDEIFEEQEKVKIAVIHVEKPELDGFIHYTVRKIEIKQWRSSYKFVRKSGILTSKVENIIDLLSFSSNFLLE